MEKVSASVNQVCGFAFTNIVLNGTERGLNYMSENYVNNTSKHGKS